MEPFEPVRTRSVVTGALNQVLDRIRSGRLVEGDTLPGERILAAQMDVSRPTVRAAIEQLVDAGIVTVGSGRAGGPRIVSIWIPEDLDRRPISVPAADEVFALLEARRAVEPRVAQLASLRGTSAHFARMEDSINLLRAHQGGIRAAAQAESLFHRIMWQASGNVPLERMLLSLSRDLEAVRDTMLRTPEDYHAGVELHEATLAAIRGGDPEEIEDEMSRHLGHFEAIVEDVLQQRMHRRVPTFLLPRTQP